MAIGEILVLFGLAIALLVGQIFGKRIPAKIKLFIIIALGIFVLSHAWIIDDVQNISNNILVSLLYFIVLFLFIRDYKRGL